LSGKLVGREFEFFRPRAGNGDPDADGEAERYPSNDSAHEYCEVIRPVILSEVREILRLSGGSAAIGDRLSIPSETEAIESGDFYSHRSVREVVFGENSRCRRIDGFSWFPSLVRIAIPSSVEFISFRAFQDCAQLREVIFEAHSHLRQIAGFSDCHGLTRIVIPSSVEWMAGSAFCGCAQLSEVIFEANSHLREIDGFWNCPSLSRMVLPPSLHSIDTDVSGRSMDAPVLAWLNFHSGVGFGTIRDCDIAIA
jgi:hypothetical protein